MALLDRVRGLFSRAPKKPEPSASGSALPDQSLWEQFNRIGGSLTPNHVSQIIRTADSGDVRQLIDLANEMRQKDAHLQCVLQTREIALTKLKWELFYPDQDPKSKKGKRQRKFVEAALRSCDGFRRSIAHLSGAIYFGFAVAETVWVTIDGRMLPKKIVCHNPRRFRFRGEDGVLVWQDQTMGQAVEFAEKFPDKFLVAQPRVNGDVPCREGLARVLVWPALFRNWTLSDWLKLAELAWKPWRLGEFQKTASKEDIAALKSIVAGMSSSGAAVHPDTVKVTMQMPSGSAGATSRSDHSGLFQVMGSEMSKAVLGQTLTTEQGNTGARALGEVHNDVRKDILESDAEWLAEVINEQLIKPLILLNFGPTAPVPQLRFVTNELADIGSFADAVQKLAGVLRIPAQWVRDQLGIPEPKADEELVQEWIEVDTSDLDEPEPANDTEEKKDEAA